MTGMRLAVPGPRDLLSVLERGAASVEQLLAVVPRLVALVDDAERMLVRVGVLLDDIEQTRPRADAGSPQAWLPSSKRTWSAVSSPCCSSIAAASRRSRCAVTAATGSSARTARPGWSSTA